MFLGPLWRVLRILKVKKLPNGYHIIVQVLNMEVAFDLGCCLRWGKATVPWL